MVEHEILPRLRERFSLTEPPLCLRLTTFGRSESDLAQSLDSLSLPEGVTLGYRSSMPIIELKLTGPYAQREAMRSLWQEVKRVAGQSLIFEGTEGLPLQIARELQKKAAQPDAERAVHRRVGGTAALPRGRAAAGQ